MIAILRMSKIDKNLTETIEKTDAVVLSLDVCFDHCFFHEEKIKTEVKN
jgi:hypothetical protein